MKEMKRWHHYMWVDAFCAVALLAYIWDELGLSASMFELFAKRMMTRKISAPKFDCNVWHDVGVCHGDGTACRGQYPNTTWGMAIYGEDNTKSSTYKQLQSAVMYCCVGPFNTSHNQSLVIDPLWIFDGVSLQAYGAHAYTQTCRRV